MPAGDGMTALMLAAESGAARCVALLAGRADIKLDALDDDGKAQR